MTQVIKRKTYLVLILFSIAFIFGCDNSVSVEDTPPTNNQIHAELAPPTQKSETDEPVVTHFGVTISGPTVLDHGEFASWTAEPKAYTLDFQWFFRDDVADPWTPAGSNSDTFNWTFFNNTQDIKVVGVRVDIYNSTGPHTDVLNISVHPDPEHCEFVC